MFKFPIESTNPEDVAKRKEYNSFFRKLGGIIHREVKYLNFSTTGPHDHHYRDGIYILTYARVIKECSFPIDRLEHFPLPTPIPDDFRIRLVAFLEDCATSKAAFYRCDWLGYVWEIIDENAYVECCQRHGFSPTDYQVRWLKSRYDEEGQPIKSD